MTDLIWPPVSPLSGEMVSSHGALSPTDWQKLSFLEAPWCARCGLPFDYDLGEGMECAPCQADRAPLEKLRAALAYDEASRGLVLALKHGGRTEGLASFAPWMARAGQALLSDADGLIPVPLHPRRIRQRGYNQSLLLAKALEKVAGVPVEPHLLARVKMTSSQDGKGVAARQRNVAGAFKIRESMLYKISGKTFVLIDDVYTTGATLKACARALKRAGAAKVSAIALARVIKPIDTTV